MDDPRRVWLDLCNAWDRARKAGKSHEIEIAYQRIVAFEQQLAEMLDMQIRCRVKLRPESGDTLAMILGEDIQKSIWEQMEYWRGEADRLVRQVDQLRREVQSLEHRLTALERGQKSAPRLVRGAS